MESGEDELGHRLRAPGQGHVDSPVRQKVRGDGDRHGAGGAGGADREPRTAETQFAGDPVAELPQDAGSHDGEVGLRIPGEFGVAEDLHALHASRARAEENGGSLRGGPARFEAGR